MKLTIFNKTKYLESIKKLKARNAPGYIIEAYNEGYTNVVNEYYNIKLQKLRTKKLKNNVNESKNYLDIAKNIKLSFVQESIKKSDIDFLKAFFQMTNLDIVTGKKLPPNASKLLKQDVIRDLGLKDLYKKLR
jgi:transcription elongation factor